MKYSALSLLLPLVVISCSEISDDANDDLIRDDEKAVIISDSSGAKAGFAFTVQTIDHDIVYQKVSSFQVGNSNDPNYGDLSLFGAFRLVPFSGEEFSKDYTIADITDYLDKSLYIYPDSTNYTGESSDLTLNIVPFTSSVTFSEMKLHANPANTGSSIGTATFSGIAKSEIKIPIDDVNYINSMLTASQTDSVDRIKEFFKTHFGFLVKASNTTVNKTQSFYAYGVAESRQPELRVKVRVFKNNIADTLDIAFGVESANQLSNFTRSPNWNLLNTDSIKYVSYSGYRLKIEFDETQLLANPVSIYDSKLKMRYSGSSKFGNSGYFTLYGSAADSTLLTPQFFSKKGTENDMTFGLSAWLQLWNLSSNLNNGFYLINADDAYSISHITFYLNDSDPAKKASVSVLYSERPGTK